jgi:CRP/FNR family transcriptional regulator
MYFHPDEVIVDVKKNEVLFRDFHALKYVYFVLEGTFKVYKYNEEGVEKIVDILHDDDYLAVTLMFSDLDEYTLNCSALTKGKVVRLSIEQMYEAFVDRKILRDYMNFTSRKLINFKNYLANSTDPEERIIIALRELYDRFGIMMEGEKVIDLPFSKTDLASFIGLRRETLSRKMTALMDEGKIYVDKNRIYLKI